MKKSKKTTKKSSRKSSRKSHKIPKPNWNKILEKSNNKTRFTIEILKKLKDKLKNINIFFEFIIRPYEFARDADYVWDTMREQYLNLIDKKKGYIMAIINLDKEKHLVGNYILCQHIGIVHTIKKKFIEIVESFEDLKGKFVWNGMQDKPMKIKL